METVGAYDAKTRLPELLKRVEKGEKITITRHGVPVAVLQPPEASQRPAPEKAIAALRRFRAKHALLRGQVNLSAIRLQLHGWSSSAKGHAGKVLEFSF